MNASSPGRRLRDAWARQPIAIPGVFNALVAKMAGDDIAKGIQLSIEYDPQPPFNCGAPSKAEPAVLDRVRQTMQRAATPAR